MGTASSTTYTLKHDGQCSLGLESKTASGSSAIGLRTSGTENPIRTTTPDGTNVGIAKTRSGCIATVQTNNGSFRADVTENNFTSGKVTLSDIILPNLDVIAFKPSAPVSAPMLTQATATSMAPAMATPSSGIFGMTMLILVFLFIILVIIVAIRSFGASNKTSPVNL